MVRPIMAGLSAFKRDVAFKKTAIAIHQNSDKLTEVIAIFVF
jgi:hypothetical protein